MIALVDYGAGNLTSVRKALDDAGRRVLDARRRPASCAGAPASSCPGVGHFNATAALDTRWRGRHPRGARRAGTPLLGICVGMQWLFEGSDEAPGVTGLGVCRGVPLPREPDPSVCELGERTESRRRRLKVPHVGWNALSTSDARRACSQGLPAGAQVYFTHSFAAPVTPTRGGDDARRQPFASVVERDNVFGVQFHPEKSSDAGLRILRNFLAVLVERTLGEAADALTKRIIACLDVRDGQVVKGVKFEGLRHAGDPAELARRYNVEGIDEVVILDITATLEKRQALAHDDRARWRTRSSCRSDRRRRHPHRRRRRRGRRGRRRQGQPEHRGPAEPGAHHHARQALRQPGGDRGHRRQAARRTGSPSTCRSGTSDAARDAVEWAREAEAIAARARSC